VAEKPTTIQHLVWGLEPDCWHGVLDNEASLGKFQADGEGTLAFALTVEAGVTHTLAVIR